jgi:small subunit ribosomal protein S17
MEEKRTHELVGTVVSDACDKTITVLVETYKNHPLYRKRVKSSKRYKAHDENGVASMGDTVKIQETRPLSATKYFRLVEVVKKASISE